MTAQDRQPFGELLAALGEIYDTPVSDLRMELFWNALADLPFATVRAAADHHARTSKFFPRPVELRPAAEDPSADADRAEVAWVALLREVRRVGYIGTPRFTDPVAQTVAMELYGGWRALCERLPAEGPEFLGAAKLFKATYQAYARCRQRDALGPAAGAVQRTLDDLQRELAERGLPVGKAH